MTTPTFITDLSKAQIEEINAYLAQNNQSPFTPAELGFLADIHNADVLCFVDMMTFIRGRFDFYGSDTTGIGVDVNGNSLNRLMSQFHAGIDAADYDEDDYIELIKETRANFENSIATYGLSLSNGIQTTTTVLYLNKHMEPLTISEYATFN